MFTACCDRIVLVDAPGQVLKRTDQVSKEFPQPQDCLAFGFLILKPGPVEVVVVIHHRSLKIIRMNSSTRTVSQKTRRRGPCPVFIKHHPIL